MTTTYPDRPAQRDEWIVSRRAPRASLDPWRPQSFLLEEERNEAGEVVPVATVFLTNRECPWRCLMCDLWKHTLAETVPMGAIPAQIDYALERLKPPPAPPFAEPAWHGRPARGLGQDARGAAVARQIKLYNSGSFFDPRAIPAGDYPAIANRLNGFERVIVECHPALVGDATLRFRDLLAGQLEVAMGLETAHPDVLAKLNKRMTLEQFQRAADLLRRNQIGLRVFILVKPPFLDEAEALPWAKQSIHFAFDCGATVAVLIPTRPGNGALEALAAQSHFSPPRLRTLEQALDYSVGLRRGRVFADLWDLAAFSTCSACFTARCERLRQINLSQSPRPSVACAKCSGG